MALPHLALGGACLGLPIGVDASRMPCSFSWMLRVFEFHAGVGGGSQEDVCGEAELSETGMWSPCLSQTLDLPGGPEHEQTGFSPGKDDVRAGRSSCIFPLMHVSTDRRNRFQ